MTQMDSDEEHVQKGEEVYAMTQIGSGEEALQLGMASERQAPSPWTPSMLRLYAILSLPYLGACLNGYDQSVMSAINAMVQYQSYFGMYAGINWSC